MCCLYMGTWSLQGTKKGHCLIPEKSVLTFQTSEGLPSDGGWGILSDTLHRTTYVSDASGAEADPRPASGRLPRRQHSSACAGLGVLLGGWLAKERTVTGRTKIRPFLGQLLSLPCHKVSGNRLGSRARVSLQPPQQPPTKFLFGTPSLQLLPLPEAHLAWSGRRVVISHSES